MIKIIIFSDSFKHFDIPIKEYEKRLSKDIEIIKIKPSKNKDEKEIIKEETIILKEKLKSLKWYKILLCINWKTISTLDLFKLIEQKKNNSEDIIFIVWWAYGLDYESLKNGNDVDFVLSLSFMTFPHSMAFLILLEQIYRVLMIKKWISYHH